MLGLGVARCACHGVGCNEVEGVDCRRCTVFDFDDLLGYEVESALRCSVANLKVKMRDT